MMVAAVAAVAAVERPWNYEKLFRPALQHRTKT